MSKFKRGDIIYHIEATPEPQDLISVQEVYNDEYRVMFPSGNTQSYFQDTIDADYVLLEPDTLDDWFEYTEAL